MKNVDFIIKRPGERGEGCQGGRAILAGAKIQPGGLGAVLRINATVAVDRAAATQLAAFLKKMHNLTAGVVLTKLDNGTSPPVIYQSLACNPDLVFIQESCWRMHRWTSKPLRFRRATAHPPVWCEPSPQAKQAHHNVIPREVYS